MNLGANWPASEVVEQIRLTRADSGAGGNVHFSMEALLRNRDSLNDELVAGPYAVPALVPAFSVAQGECPDGTQCDRTRRHAVGPHDRDRRSDWLHARQALGRTRTIRLDVDDEHRAGDGARAFVRGQRCVGAARVGRRDGDRSHRCRVAPNESAARLLTGRSSPLEPEVGANSRLDSVRAPEWRPHEIDAHVAHAWNCAQLLLRIRHDLRTGRTTGRR